MLIITIPVKRHLPHQATTPSHHPTVSPSRTKQTHLFTCRPIVFPSSTTFLQTANGLDDEHPCCSHPSAPTWPPLRWWRSLPAPARRPRGCTGASPRACTCCAHPLKHSSAFLFHTARCATAVVHLSLPRVYSAAVALAANLSRACATSAPLSG